MNKEKRKKMKYDENLQTEVKRERDTLEYIVKEMHQIALEKTRTALTSEEKKDRLHKVMVFLEKALGEHNVKRKERSQQRLVKPQEPQAISQDQQQSQHQDQQQSQHQDQQQSQHQLQQSTRTTGKRCIKQ